MYFLFPRSLACTLIWDFNQNVRHQSRGAWVFQSGNHLTLNFSSGHDLMGHGIELHIRLCADSAKPAWDSLSPSLPLLCNYSLSLSLSKNKIK